MTDNPREAYGTGRLGLYALMSVLVGVLIAGFWNYHLVDGFGRHVVAGTTLGDTARLADSFASRGADFGFLFGLVAGLAATFTACNCVVFAMIPGLVCSRDAGASTVNPWRALGMFVGGVLVVSAVYGAVVGTLGPRRVAWLNRRPVRLLQARGVFSVLGVAMMAWGVFELGFVAHAGRSFRERFELSLSSATLKAGLLGVFVGLFAVGRPFPVFRQFLTYAASARSPVYGAGVMMMQGLGQIVVMVLLFLGLVWCCGRWLARWARRHPPQPYLVSGLALLGGGAFFLFYWGLALTYDLGQWGFKLGWY